jgi:archaellum component FlaF (FlaF/FlaG flagellin family)
MRLATGIFITACILIIFGTSYYVFSEGYERIDDEKKSDESEPSTLEHKYSGDKYIDSNRKRHPPGLDPTD